MKNNTYRDAVDHLRFSDDLYQNVVKRARGSQRPRRIVGVFVATVLITVLLAGTAVGVNYVVSELLDKQEVTVPVHTLGTQKDTFEDAQVMHFSVTSGLPGVNTHYMELAMGDVATQYLFVRGLLCSWASTYYRIADDYRLEIVEFKTTSGWVDKGDDRYTVDPAYRYYERDDGVISAYHGPLPKNEAGEILINVYCLVRKKPDNIGDPAWPAYLNVETGQIRDAMPQLSPEDFEGRICYTRRFRDGILFTTLVNEGAKSVHNRYYWVDETTLQIVPIELPGKGFEFVYQDTMYYQDETGKLYQMDDHFTFHLISEYETPAMLGAGLLLVMTTDGKLGIYDVDRDMTYVFNDIEVTKNDLMNYGTLRRGDKIVLLKTVTNWELMGTQITQVGVLDPQSNELRLIEFDNDLLVTHCSWLADDRLGMIYQRGQRQYLCIYEFE